MDRFATVEQLCRDVIEICISIVVRPPKLGVGDMECERGTGMPQRVFGLEHTIAADTGDFQPIVTDIAARDVTIVTALQICAIGICIGCLEEYVFDVCIWSAFNVDMAPDSHADRTAHDIPAVHMWCFPGIQGFKSLYLRL